MTPLKPMSVTQTEKYLEDFQKWIDARGTQNNTMSDRQKFIDDLTNKMLKKQMDDMYAQGHAMTNMKQDDKVTAPVQEVFNPTEVSEILRLKYLAKSMCDESFLYSLYEENLVIAGGCFASWYHNEDLKDIDVFIIGNLEQQVAIKKTIQDTQPDLIDVSDYRRDNDKIIGVYNNPKSKVQFIFTQYRTREELIDHFDFKHCKVSYHKGNLYINRDTFDSLRDKRLVANQPTRIKQWRVEKFVNRGWESPVGYHVANKVQPVNAIPSSGGPWHNTGARINPMRGNWAAVATKTNQTIKDELDELIKKLENNDQWTA
jgi:hypothetical protein